MSGARGTGGDSTRAIDSAILGILAERWVFLEVEAAVAASVVETAGAVDVATICRVARAVLAMDAEDFDELPLPVDPGLAELIRRSAVPESLDELAAMGPNPTLEPLFRLLLEVIAVRWERKEADKVVELLHLLTEFLPHLAWESVVGYPFDPRRLGKRLGGKSSYWGKLDAPESCPHPVSVRRTAAATTRRSDRAIEPFFKHIAAVGRGLALCASHVELRGPSGRPLAACPQPCQAWQGLPRKAKRQLEARTAVARLIATSSVANLRNGSTAGHGFDVPEPQELLNAWAASVRHVHAEITRLDLVEDLVVPLPPVPESLGAVTLPAEVAALVSAVAGHAIDAADTLHRLRDTVLEAVAVR